MEGIAVNLIFYLADNEHTTIFLPAPLENGFVWCNFAHIKELFLSFKRDGIVMCLSRFSLIKISIFF
jgi:hypothetical protein